MSSASHLITIAFSAGGLDPIRQILRDLPTDFAAAVVIVHHVHGETGLPEILASSTALRVRLAEDHERLMAQTVYVCPAHRHLFIRPERTIGLSIASRVRFARPPADWVFESAASVFGRCSTAVVLSGRLSDGARGVVWTKRSDGQTVAQTPSSCAYASMPKAAIKTGCVDLVLDPVAIAPALCELIHDDEDRAQAREWEEPFVTAGP